MSTEDDPKRDRRPLSNLLYPPEGGEEDLTGRCPLSNLLCEDLTTIRSRVAELELERDILRLALGQVGKTEDFEKWRKVGCPCTWPEWLAGEHWSLEPLTIVHLIPKDDTGSDTTT